MPLVFVHGVNTRRGDTPKERQIFDDRIILLKEQFRTAFVDRVTSTDGLEVFTPYWGDLGVTFSRNLACLPQSGIQTLAISDPSSVALAASVAGKLDADIIRIDALRSDPLLTIAKLRSLATAVDLLFAGSANSPTPDILAATMTAALPDATRFAAAAERYAAANPRPAWLDQAKDDQDFIARLYNEVLAHATAEASGTTSKIQSLAIGSDVLTWMKNGVNKVQAAVNNVVETVTHAVGGAPTNITRAAFIELSGYVRPTASAFIGRFFGDVFKYLESRQAITNQVLTEIRSAIAACRPGDAEMYLVGHSFGGIILYDILTTSALNPPLKCDLYVTVGSQVALFAEIDRLADKAGIAAGLSESATSTIGRPSNAARWINIFDLTDMVGFGTRGVFQGVRDCRFDTDALPLISHSAYFDTPRFFARLRERVNEAFEKGTDE
jgi:hypothetical protein